jgi:hypothetical protein
MSRKGRENTAAILGGLLQGGLAVAQVYQKQKQEEELDRDIAKAVSEMPENATSMQQIQYLAQQRGPVREAMARLMKDVPRQQSPREQIAPEQLFSNIIKKTLGATPNNEQVARAEQIFAIGGPLLEQGVHPIAAYNQARAIVQGKQDSTTALQKQIVGPSSSFFGGGKALKNDISRVKHIKKLGFLDDDELAAGLLQKGYGPEDLFDKFDLNPSQELAAEIGLVAAPVPQKMQPMQQGKKRLTEEDFNRFMQAASGNPDKAAELAEAEGYDIEAA